MEPKVLASDGPDRTARSRSLRWLPGILLALAVLAALLVMGSTPSAQSEPAGVLANPWATEFCRYYGMACAMGDFDGDGDNDIVAFNRYVSTGGAVGDVRVALSNGTSFLDAGVWRTGFAINSSEIPKVGDFNGDGKDDIIVFVRGSSGTAWVALSSGYDFGKSGLWIEDFCKSGEICDVGDFNGDGSDDVARFTRNVYITDLTDDNWGKVYLAYSDKYQQKFIPQTASSKRHFCLSYGVTYPEVCGSGDFNGDGWDDIVAFSKDSGTVWVALNHHDGSFGNANIWTPNEEPYVKAFCMGNEVCGVGDFNGDGHDDIIAYLRSLYSGKVGWVYVGLSDGSSFPYNDINQWDSNFCTGNEICGTGAYIDGVTSYVQISRTGDFNGDKRADVVRFLRYTNSQEPGYVYVKLAYGNGFVDALAPTSTPTPSRTPTRTSTPTVTNTPTITPTPSNTPTPMPPRAWLPVILR